MPLFADGLKKIRRGLELVRDGKPSPYVNVGAFTPAELEAINKLREAVRLLPITAVIVFNGKHMYASRCVKDSYTVEEVVEQVSSAFCSTAVVGHDRGTILRNTVARIDSAGNRIYDRAVFECSQKQPSPLLWSVVPSGDGRNK